MAFSMPLSSPKAAYPVAEEASPPSRDQGPTETALPEGNPAVVNG